MDAYHVHLELVYHELVALEVLGRISNPTGMDRVCEALGSLQSLIVEDRVRVIIPAIVHQLIMTDPVLLREEREGLASETRPASV